MPNQEIQPRLATPPISFERVGSRFQSRLLRLPPELIQSILSYVLPTFGIQGVVRLRLVSKAFYGMIDAGVFTGNYFRDQIHTRGRRISQSYLAKFLISKVVQDHQRKTPLSQLVHGAVDTALEYPYFISNKEKLRDDYIVALCGAMAFFLEAQALDVYDDTKVDISSFEKRKAALAGAAAMGQTGLLCQMLPTTSEDSQYFGPLLGVAALNGHAATTEVLLQRGFQIDFLGLLTTLQAACIGGNEEIVHGLLIFHSDSQKFSYEYQSAIILAVENSHWRIALHLFHHTTISDTTWLKQTMFCCAAKVGCSEMIDAMLDDGVDIYCHDPRHVSHDAFDHAASKGHLHVLKLLQVRGFDISRSFSTSVQYAIQGGHLAVLQYLLDREETYRTTKTTTIDLLWLMIVRVAKKCKQGHIVQYIYERQPESLLYAEDSSEEDSEEVEDEEETEENGQED